MKFPDLIVTGTGGAKIEMKYASKKLKQKPVEVENVSGIINDEKVDITIQLSNGESITSDYKIARIHRDNGFSCPYELDKYWGSTGSVIGDILLLYAQKTDSIISK